MGLGYLVKTGRLRHRKCCGCLSITYHKDKTISYLSSFFCFGCFFAVFYAATQSYEDPLVHKLNLIALYVSSILYIYLNFTSPGIPSHIMARATLIAIRGKDRGLHQDLTATTHWEIQKDNPCVICWTCKQKFGILDPDIYADEPCEHCEECKVCITRGDHHCEILDRCIGKSNKIAFWTWLVIFLTQLGYIFMVWFIAFLGNRPWNKD